MKGGVLVLWCCTDPSEHLAAASLKEANVRIDFADRFKQTQGTYSRGRGHSFKLSRSHRDEASRCKIVNLIGGSCFEQFCQIMQILKVPVDEMKARVPQNAEFMQAPQMKTNDISGCSMNDITLLQQ